MSLLELCTVLLLAHTVYGGELLGFPKTFRTVAVDNEEFANITCIARLSVGDNLHMQHNGDLAVFVMVPTLDNTGVNGLPGGLKGRRLWWEEELLEDSVLLTIGISITDPQRSDTGDYNCIYSGSDDSATSLYKLTVHGPPYAMYVNVTGVGVVLQSRTSFDVNMFPKTDEIYNARINIDNAETFELEATAEGLPTSNYTWHRIFKDKTESIIGVKNSITIDRDPSTLNDTMFVVSAMNNYGTYNITIIVYLEYAPRPPVIINAVNYPLRGEGLQAVCEFDAYPEATVFYVKISPNDWRRLHNAENGILIPSIDLDRDVGEYQCKGENIHGESVGKIYIEGKPKDLKVEISKLYSESANFIISVFSATEVSVNLTLTHEEQRGVLRQESLLVEGLGADQVPNLKHIRTLTDLRPSTNYSVQIQVYNDYGGVMLEDGGLFFTTYEEGFTPPTTTQMLKSEGSTAADVSKSTETLASSLLIIAASLAILL